MEEMGKNCMRYSKKTKKKGKKKAREVKEGDRHPLHVRSHTTFQPRLHPCIYLLIIFQQVRPVSVLFARAAVEDSVTVLFAPVGHDSARSLGVEQQTRYQLVVTYTHRRRVIIRRRHHTMGQTDR